MVLGLLWPRVFETYLNGVLNDILDSLYRTVVLNGILTHQWFEWYFKLALSSTEISLNGLMVLNGIQW